MARDPVRVVIWGAGQHARRRLIPALATSHVASLYGVTTRDAERRAGLEREFGCKVWELPGEMLSDPAVDVVYVATPTGLHFAHAREVLAAGKHLWCEKSLVTAEREAAELLSLAKQRDLAVCEAFMYRHHPQFAEIERTIRDASFGRVFSLSCRFGIPHQDRGGFRYRRALGGGALLDVGCYPLHLAQQLLGPLRVCHRSISTDGEIDIEGAAVLVSGSNVRVFLEWGYGLAYRNEVFVWGESATLFADRVFSKPADKPTEVVVANRTGQRTISIPAVDSFAVMIDDLVHTVEDSRARRRQWADVEAQANLLGQLGEGSP